MISSHSEFREDLYRELTQNILPFWMERMPDQQYGGFYGQVNGRNQIVPKAGKGGILNARILWTFSAAGRLLKEDKYLQTAKRAHDYMFSHFFDKEFGGTYWLLDYAGKPADTKKQIYSQAFFIYALVEYHMATGDKESLEKVIELFRLIEEKSFDPVSNGYFEAYDRQWQLLDDLRLSPKDANEKKTMNTHLHILEAYTNLFRIWKDPLLAERLGNLIEIFLEKIIDPDSQHLTLFFDEGWNRKSSIVSFGHDIESSWLLFEAALVLGDQKLIERARQKCLRIVLAAEKGLQRDGSIIYEMDPAQGHIDEDRHWWAQAEAVVGFYNAFELSRNKRYLYLSKKSFLYIQNNLIDPQGEWYWSIKSDGSINREDDKAGFWKCPYHNSRMCMEMMSWLSKVH